MKKHTLLVMIALSFVSAFGQKAIDNEPLCTNQMAEKISSRGISLGMSQQEVLNLFAENGKLTTVYSEYLQNEGRSKYTNNEVEYQNVVNGLQTQATRLFGFSLITLAPKDKSRFGGIDRYNLGFLDNRLASFNVYYLKPKWESREQFIRKMSEILNLPIREDRFNVSPYSLKCGNYIIDFSQEYNVEAEYSMRISANVNEIIQQRRKKADDEQREKDIKTFKP